MRRAAKVLVVIVGLLVLAGSAAVAGRIYLPAEVIGLGSSRTAEPSQSPDYRSIALTLRRDFDALAATIREAASNSRANTMRDEYGRRVEALGQRVTANLPVAGSVGVARSHYFEAIKKLHAATDVIFHEANAFVVRDLVHQAEAEWKKGDDALR